MCKNLHSKSASVKTVTQSVEFQFGLAEGLAGAPPSPAYERAKARQRSRYERGRLLGTALRAGMYCQLGLERALLQALEEKVVL